MTDDVTDPVNDNTAADTGSTDNAQVDTDATDDAQVDTDATAEPTTNQE